MTMMKMGMIFIVSIIPHGRKKAKGNFPLCKETFVGINAVKEYFENRAAE